jgi:acyl CoA:acetate/3-ketoacid CoA transferase alpha subunit
MSQSAVVTARNFNPMMASAAGHVIAEVDEIVDEFGDPDVIVTPQLYVDTVVLADGGTDER